MQDDRPARLAALRQEHEGVEPGAVAHRHHDLKTAGVGHLQTTSEALVPFVDGYTQE
jgi:hypothetical protein